MRTRIASLTLAVWARRLVRRRLKVLAQQLLRLERAPDADAIHDVRVASRRLRAALRHWEPCFAVREVKRLQGAARSVAGLLGEVRDLDIWVENLAAGAARRGPAPTRLVARLKAQRADKLRRALPEAQLLRRRLPALRRRLLS